jgi:exonuclease SbcD
MRIVVCGDTHIGAVFGLGRPNGKGGNTRVDDYEKTLNYIIDHTIETKADIFVQTGDMFEHRDPSIEHMNIVDKALKRLSNANIATFVIMGNHDYKKSGSSFTSSIVSLSAVEYPNVRMLLDPEVVQICNAENESVNLILLPYRDRKMYKGNSVKEQSEEYNLQLRGLIQSVPNDDPILAIGHNFFYEGSFNDYGGTEIMVSPMAFKGCDIAMMGHLHQFRVLRKHSPACVYTGSMERSNFGDAGVEKYFVDYNISNKKAKFCRIPTRDLLDTSIDLSGLDFSEIGEALETALEEHDVKDKIVRFKLLIDEKVLPAVDRATIQSSLYNLGAFHVSKVGIETIVDRIVRDDSVLSQKDDFSMFKAFVDSQGIDGEYKKSLLKEAKIIMGEI